MYKEDFIMADTSIKKVKRSRISLWVEKFKAADKDDKKKINYRFII